MIFLGANERNAAAIDKELETKDKPIIEISDMHKWYGEFPRAAGHQLERWRRGERIVICGPSGSGKSTLIRASIAWKSTSAGRIIVDGTELTNDLKNIEKIRAEVGMVFQHFNLFPHLTILENLTLGPIWVRKTPKKEAEETAMHYLEKVQHRRAGARNIPAALRRSAATCGHRPKPLHGPQSDAVSMNPPRRWTRR
jgi:general L-amino acid transport system ATP-binding protein